LPSPLYCSLHTRSIPLNPHLPPPCPSAGKVSPKILKKEVKITLQKALQMENSTISSSGNKIKKRRKKVQKKSGNGRGMHLVSQTAQLLHYIAGSPRGESR
jgi:hypothetical protein